MIGAKGTQPPGTSIDSHGGPVADPTANVLSLVEAAVKRLDDLRVAEMRRVDDLAALRESHSKELALAEAKRIDAIRAVDVNAVAVASERATQQASVLATQVTASADALRALVAQTATTMATASEKFSAQLTERLALIERAQYEGKGRQGVTDPQMEKLTELVAVLAKNQAAGTGKGEGIGVAWVALLGVVAMMSGLVSVGSVVYQMTRSSTTMPAPQVVYVPAPSPVAAPTK